MRVKKSMIMFVIVAFVMAGLGMSVSAQKGNKVKFQDEYDELSWQAQDHGNVEAKAGGVLTRYDYPLPQVDAATTVDFALHNFDLANTRFVALDQINTSNVKSLAPRWILQVGRTEGGFAFQSTPIVVGGMMYVTDATGSVFAVDAATGRKVWTFTVPPDLPRKRTRNRGAVYADGNIYTNGGSKMWALDAKTGEPLQTFGDNGIADVLLPALQAKYPDLTDATTLGYDMDTAAQYHNGVLYIGSQVSENHIPGGYLFAIDAKTAKVLWSFNTIPQGPEDQGWDVAKDTWVGGERNGGGIWETPAIDTDLGVIYVQTANPYPFTTGANRAGVNLFTNGILALDLNTGQIKWFYQQTHHDLWDYDSASPPLLFDMHLGGQTVKAVAESSKNGYLYILNRETGQPVNPIAEIPVPTQSATAGEQPWPTQPIPFTASGHPMASTCPVFPVDIPADRVSRAVPWCTPPGPNQVRAPGSTGGTNFGPLSYSPRTGMIYVPALDSPAGSGRTGLGYFSAFDANTGELEWQVKLPERAYSGSIATSGDVVFVGDYSSSFYAFDARTGEQLWKYNTGDLVKASPTAFELNGEEYIAVNAGNVVLTFALPIQ